LGQTDENKGDVKYVHEMRTIKGSVYRTKRRKQIPAEERRLGTNLALRMLAQPPDIPTVQIVGVEQ